MIGLGRPTGQTALIAAWYLGLTAVTLAFAYRDRGIRRVAGILIIGAYIVFTASLLVPANEPDWLLIVIPARHGSRRHPGCPAAIRPPPQFPQYQPALPIATGPGNGGPGRSCRHDSQRSQADPRLAVL